MSIDGTTTHVDIVRKRLTGEITSPASKKLKEWKALLTGRGIKKYRKTIVSGAKIVSDIINSKPEIINECIIPSSDPVVPKNLPGDIPVYSARAALFRELDMFGTQYPLLVAAVPELLPFDNHVFDDAVTLLIPFQDPANIGAVVRSAAAFGVRNIVFLEEAATPYHPKSVRASGSYVFSVNFYKGGSLYDLTELPVPVVALSAEGTNIAEFVFPERFALLVGIEGQGIPDSLCPEYTVAIPIAAGVESLNAVVAASIALYEWKKRR